MSSGTIAPGRSIPPTRKPPHLLRWVAVACIAAVLIEVGAVTDGFGLPSLLAHHGGVSSPPNLNPFSEPINAVNVKLVYGVDEGNPFSFPDGSDLCHCPRQPILDTNVTPDVIGIYLYFNITNTGKNYSQIANFSVSSSGANTSLFKLGCVATQGHGCNEPLVGVSFLPDQTWALVAWVYTASIPYDGSAGYTLTFHMTSP